MRITQHTDYGLRVLLFLAANPNQLHTIQAIAAHYDVSRQHLMKVVNHLIRLGFVSGTRGRNGGLLLAKPSKEIVVGEVVRQMEPDLLLVDCMREQGTCLLGESCRLQHLFNKALQDFLRTLDQVNLAQLLSPQTQQILFFPTGTR